jgi:hypothetical protein
MLATVSAYVRRRARGRVILGLIAFFVAFETATVPVLRRVPGGATQPIDGRFFYTPEEAFLTLGSYAAAKRVWIGAYLTWDTVNPVFYASILSLLMSWLLGPVLGPESRMHKLNLLPLGAGAFDVLENISIVSLLAVYPHRVDVVAWLSTGFTMGKVCLLGASTILMVLAVGRRAMRTFRRRRGGLTSGCS